jgi:multiple sugar transport system ATP-binding protein
VASITLSKVSKVYPPSVRAVDDLSLDVGDGEVVVLLGGPGCGKSTLLRMVAGIERPTSGQILFDGVDVAAATPPERRVAMLFQRPALYPKLTVAANIGFPLQTASVRAERATALVRASARATGVAGLLDKHPHELTDEQQQRVAVARAMVRSPRLLLLDEPVSQVGGTAGAKLLAEIATLVRDAGITAVYVTPERGDAPAVADRIGVMRNGRIEDIGPPSRVYDRPATAFTAALVGGPAVTLLDATVEMEDGSHTAAWLGRVGLALPWRDLQARELTHFHGERVVVGIPPEALRLVGPGPNAIGGPVLPGVVRRVVPLGAFSDSAVDIGGTAVDLDRDRSDDGEGGGRASSGALRRVEELAAVGGRHGRHGKHGPRRDLSEIPRASTTHPAELTVRTARADAPQQGSRVFVRVDLSRVHFFDDRGRRIGTGWR